MICSVFLLYFLLWLQAQPEVICPSFSHGKTERPVTDDSIFTQCHIQQATPKSTVDWVYWSPKSTQITPSTITQASVWNGLSFAASLPERHVLMFHWKVRGVVRVSVCTHSLKANICPPIFVHLMYACTTTPFHDLCPVLSSHYHSVGKLQALSSQWRAC